MNWGNIYNVDTTSAFTGDVIGTVQSAIKAAFFDGDTHYPLIGVCDMRAADTFTVAFNRENKLTAVKMPSGEYGVHYEGGIGRIEFAEATTLTWFQVQWAPACGPKNVLSVPLTVKTNSGEDAELLVHDGNASYNVLQAEYNG